MCVILMTPAADRIIVANGTDLAVALRFYGNDGGSSVVVAKVQGVAPYPFLIKADALFERI